MLRRTGVWWLGWPFTLRWIGGCRGCCGEREVRLWLLLWSLCIGLIDQLIAYLGDTSKDRLRSVAVSLSTVY
jgi:hypothetical protein